MLIMLGSSKSTYPRERRLLSAVALSLPLMDIISSVSSSPSISILKLSAKAFSSMVMAFSIAAAISEAMASVSTAMPASVPGISADPAADRAYSI